MKLSINIKKAKDFSPMSKGIHTFVVTTYEAKPSANGNFTNLFWNFECVSSDEPENIGKMIMNYCTTLKPDAEYGLTNLMRATGYIPAEQNEESIQQDVDCDELLGLQFQAQTSIKTVETKKEDGTVATRHYTTIESFIF